MSSLTRSSTDIDSSTQGLVRMRAIRDSGTVRLPTRLLSDSIYTGRLVSKFRSACQMSVSKCFWLGCGVPGMRPSTELRWRASPSRSSTCSPAARSACRTCVFPTPVCPKKINDPIGLLGEFKPALFRWIDLATLDTPFETPNNKEQDLKHYHLPAQ